MRLQQDQCIDEGLFDLRRSSLVGADKPHPRHHALANCVGIGEQFLIVDGRRAVQHQPARCRDLIHFPRPAVMKHPFVAPLVGELLQQHRDESGNGIGRHNRRQRDAILDRFNDRCGVLEGQSVGRHH